jgi:putative ABC transport system permease protein
VVGVLEDIRLRGGRDKPEATFYARDPAHMVSLSVRFAGVPPAQMQQALQAAWQQVLAQTPFSATLVEDTIAGYYRSEMRTGQLLALFAGLAIVLCALGLYGLAVFTAQRRTREIGLRKLMGAKVADIVKLLLWQFTQPVLWALLIAFPVAAWLMRDWLNGFDQRIALTPWPFVAGGAPALRHE